MLVVDPGELPNVGGRLTVHYADLMTAITKTQAAVAAVAKPMGADQTSLRAAMHFNQHQESFYTNTHDGADKWLKGADLIVPISTDYADTDGSGGATVSSALQSGLQSTLGRYVDSVDDTVTVVTGPSNASTE